MWADKEILRKTHHTYHYVFLYDFWVLTYRLHEEDLRGEEEEGEIKL